MRVIPHDVPQHRPLPDHRHRFRAAMDSIEHSHPEATAEEYDLHDSPLRSDDFEFRDREDQPSPPRPDVAELATYFLPQVPRQDENVVGPGLGETFRRIDR